ncbi:MAG: hypothetical protein ACE5NW_18065 [Acidiferrobacterales bacterium]
MKGCLRARLRPRALLATGPVLRGTTPGMEELESRREQRPRARGHDGCRRSGPVVSLRGDTMLSPAFPLLLAEAGNSVDREFVA